MSISLSRLSYFLFDFLLFVLCVVDLATLIIVSLVGVTWVLLLDFAVAVVDLHLSLVCSIFFTSVILSFVFSLASYVSFIKEPFIVESRLSFAYTVHLSLTPKVQQVLVNLRS